MQTYTIMWGCLSLTTTMNFTFEIWGKCNSGIPVVCEQWCDVDWNKNTDFKTIQTCPLELGKKIISLPSWLENTVFMVSL